MKINEYSMQQSYFLKPACTRTSPPLIKPERVRKNRRSKVLESVRQRLQYYITFNILNNESGNVGCKHVSLFLSHVHHSYSYM
jgi:hypothetical protein